MVRVEKGQCGLCAYFGAHESSPRVLEVRTTHQAAENLVAPCGHPSLAAVHLQVTPVSGCDGFAELD